MLDIDKTDTCYIEMKTQEKKKKKKKKQKKKKKKKKAFSTHFK